jgi:hypothetical protein
LEAVSIRLAGQGAEAELRSSRKGEFSVSDASSDKRLDTALRCSPAASVSHAEGGPNGGDWIVINASANRHAVQRPGHRRSPKFGGGDECATQRISQTDPLRHHGGNRRNHDGAYGAGILAARTRLLPSGIDYPAALSFTRRAAGSSQKNTMTNLNRLEAKVSHTLQPQETRHELVSTTVPKPRYGFPPGCRSQ